MESEVSQWLARHVALHVMFTELALGWVYSLKDLPRKLRCQGGPLSCPIAFPIQSTTALNLIEYRTPACVTASMGEFALCWLQIMACCQQQYQHQAEFPLVTGCTCPCSCATSQSVAGNQPQQALGRGVLPGLQPLLDSVGPLRLSALPAV